MWYKTAMYTGLALASLALGQCTSTSQTPDQPPILANFYVRYLADVQELMGEANFYRGDSLPVAQPLTFDQGVAFMGSGMNMQETPGLAARYRAKLTGPLPQPLRFSFSEQAGQDPYTVTIPMPTIDSLRVLPGAGLRTGIKLSIGRPLADDESLLLMFSNSKGFTKSILLEGPTTADQLWAPPPALAEFSADDYQLAWILKKTISDEQPGLKIKANAEYFGQWFNQRIEP